MKRLAYRIAAHKCPNHKQPYLFVYNGIVQNNERRMLCEDCINPKNANRLINIKKALRFLREQQIQEDKEIYQVKARLCSSRRSSKKVVAKINSINDNGVDTTMIDELLGEETNKLNIELIGEQLTKLQEQDNFGKYKIKQERDQDNQRVQLQLNYFQCIKKLMVPICNQIQVSKLILNEKRIEQGVSNHFYQTIQTNQMQAQINSLCFNHDETQFIASVGTSWIRQIKFSCHSTQLISCGDDSQIVIWSIQPNGKWIIQDRLSTHSNSVYSICLNHDSTILASGSWDKSIQIHCRINDQWQLQQQLTEHASFVYDVCFNHNSTLLAAGSYNNRVIIWEQNQQGIWIIKQELTGHTEAVNRISFNTDSTLLLSCSHDKSIKLWQLDQDQLWKCNHTLIGHADTVRSVQFNRQSNMIVSSSDDNSIKIWSEQLENKWKCVQTIREHQDMVECVIINNDSSMIISGSYDNTIMIHLIQLKQ